MRTLIKVALGVWLARWLAGEVAAYAGRHWRRHGPPPIESERAPGWMPGPEGLDRGMAPAPRGPIPEPR